MRPARLADLQALLELEAACYPPQQAYSAREYRYALAQGRSVNLLDEEGGRVVGFVGAFHHRAWRAGHVYTLNVHPKERRRGLGARLLRACEDELRALGMDRLLLEVNVRNAAAIALYEREGYARLQQLADYYHGYEDNDAFVYEKRL